jgi:hypothetical protein
LSAFELSAFVTILGFFPKIVSFGTENLRGNIGKTALIPCWLCCWILFMALSQSVSKFGFTKEVSRNVGNATTEKMGWPNLGFDAGGIKTEE